MASLTSINWNLTMSPSRHCCSLILLYTGVNNFFKEVAFYIYEAINTTTYLNSRFLNKFPPKIWILREIRSIELSGLRISRLHFPFFLHEKNWKTKTEWVLNLRAVLMWQKCTDMDFNIFTTIEIWKNLLQSSEISNLFSRNCGWFLRARAAFDSFWAYIDLKTLSIQNNLFALTHSWG